MVVLNADNESRRVDKNTTLVLYRTEKDIIDINYISYSKYRMQPIIDSF